MKVLAAPVSIAFLAGIFTLSALADDSASQAVQQQLLQRQQQQDELRLRMEQDRARAQRSPSDAIGVQQLDRAQLEQRQQQQTLHQRQLREEAASRERSAVTDTQRESLRASERLQWAMEREEQLKLFKRRAEAPPPKVPADYSPNALGNSKR